MSDFIIGAILGAEIMLAVLVFGTSDKWAYVSSHAYESKLVFFWREPPKPFLGFIRDNNPTYQGGTIVDTTPAPSPLWDGVDIEIPEGVKK